LRKTFLLIFLCVLTTIFTPALGGNQLINYLGFSGNNLMKGYFWTPVTALFIHVDSAHLIGNMLFLYVFGNTLEKEVGSKKMLLAFFLGGFLSFILSLYFYGFEVIMVGSSAAIFTLIAVDMLIKPLKFSFIFLMPLGLVAILYFIYNIIFAVVLSAGKGSVAYISHIIGFLIGVPMGVLWSRGKWKRNMAVTVVLLVTYALMLQMLSSL